MPKAETYSLSAKQEQNYNMLLPSFSEHIFSKRNSNIIPPSVDKIYRSCDKINARKQVEVKNTGIRRQRKIRTRNEQQSRKFHLDISYALNP